ncbi:MAG: T9SS type A sorting domain-containing protein [Bacteroidales bacterium]|nr:T9SS type A sorting domain-containing protein [Bacteroidales bacterium]
MKKKILLLSLLATFFSAIVFASDPKNANEKKKNSEVADDPSLNVKASLDYINLIRANQVTGSIGAVDVLNARNQLMNTTTKSSRASLGLSWKEMGPDNFSGRTKAILVSKSNSNILYAGSCGSGLWRSVNGGVTWYKVVYAGTSTAYNNFENLVITCITQAENGDIYFGTGEGFSLPTYSKYDRILGVVGQGVWKSTDGGATFAQLASTIPSTIDSGAAWAYINRIAADPRAGYSDRIYAATNKGLMLSTDGGNNWIVAKTSTTDTLKGNTVDVEVGSDGSVACAVGTADTSKFYISPNGDDGSFVCKSGAAVGKLPLSGSGYTVGRLEIAIAPSNPDYIYCSAVKKSSSPNIDGKICGIYQSTDKGETWTVIGPGGSPQFDPYGGNGWYACALAVHPTNANRIITGGLDMWQWQSGNTWVKISTYNTSYLNGFYIHASQHTYVFDKNNSSVLYIGNDGGISKSTDGGTTFKVINIGYKTAATFTVAQSYDGLAAAGTQANGTIYLDKLGNTSLTAKSFYSSTSDGYSDCGQTAFSLIHKDLMMLSLAYGGIYRSPDRGGQFTYFGLSTTAGAVDKSGYITPYVLWENFHNPYSLDSTDFINGSDTIFVGDLITLKSRNFEFPVKHIVTSSEGTILPHDTVKFQDSVQSKMFIGRNGDIWFTKDPLVFGGFVTRWVKMYSQPVDVNNPVKSTYTAIAISKDGNVVFAGTANGKLYRIKGLLYNEDSAHCYKNSSQYALDTATIADYPNRVITSIATDPNDTNNVIVTLGNYGYNDYVYYSDNALDSAHLVVFSSKQANLLKAPAYSSLILQWNSDKALVGTDYGVFSTANLFDATPVWEDENGGELSCHVPVSMIRQQTSVGEGPYWTNNAGVIYISTLGRGVFEARNYLSVPDRKGNPSVKNSLDVYPNPASNSATITYTLQNTSDVNINIYDLQGRTVKSIILAKQTKGKHNTEINCSGLSSGTYILEYRTTEKSVTSKLIITR